MVHCNNGASELGSWAEVFGRFAAVLGHPAEPDAVFGALLGEALEGDADGGGLLAYNYLAGEPITGLAEGRPLIVRTPGSRLTLGNFMRTQVYGAFATLSLGMRVLRGEGVAGRHPARARRHVPHRRRGPALPGRRGRRTGRGLADRR